MKARNESVSQSLKALIATTIFLVMLLNTSILVPVSPVLAESEPEGQTCSACSCCQQTQLTETFHHVTVNIVDGEIVLQIEPLLLPETGCGACAENQGCASGGFTTNIQFTVLQQEETHTVILLTYEVNGTTFEATMTHTLLWSYNELTDEINRTARFISTEITTEDVSTQFYSLSYLVQHAEYNLTLYTRLVPLGSETYNSSFTIMNYAQAGKYELTSLEFVELNSTFTLSQQYAVLGKVAKEVEKLYEESGDETLAELAQGYYTMKKEAKYLSKLVEKQLQEYDKEILQSMAVLMDDFWGCLWCDINFSILCYLGCALLCVAWPPFCLFVLFCMEYGCELAVHLTCEYLGYCP